VLISLSPLFLLSLLDPVISDFLYAMYSLSKLYYFILGELFINAYRFVYYRPRPVKAYIGYCDGGTQDSNIKTVLFILRTIDIEEGRQ
jgi:hypothetical protein